MASRAAEPERAVGAVRTPAALIDLARRSGGRTPQAPPHWQHLVGDAGLRLGPTFNWEPIEAGPGPARSSARGPAAALPQAGAPLALSGSHEGPSVPYYTLRSIMRR